MAQRTSMSRTNRASGCATACKPAVSKRNCSPSKAPVTGSRALMRTKLSKRCSHFSKNTFTRAKTETEKRLLNSEDAQVRSYERARRARLPRADQPERSRYGKHQTPSKFQTPSPNSPIRAEANGAVRHTTTHD